jgi:alpha-ribazole phosphatase
MGVTMRLVLVRHPRPEVAEGLCYGRTDLPAAPGQAAQVLAALSAADLPPRAALYSSPLLRCRDLAQAFAAQRGTELHLDARLAEMDFGAWEMRPWDAIPRAQIDAWAEDLPGYRPGGGETVLEMAARVAAFLAALRAGGQRQQRDAIVICHAGTMRLLAALQAGLPLRETALRAARHAHAIPYGGVLTLDL